MIYLDNAASTWPKPDGVAEAVRECIEGFGANPGRGSHALSRRAGQVIEETRQMLARFFHIRDPHHLFFCPSATHAINQALKGLLQPGDHVITSCWEHNAVARPLEELKKERGIEVTRIPPENGRGIDVSRLKQAIRRETRLIVTTHGSNVTGETLPVSEIGSVARKHGVWYMVDAAQTAGVLPIDVEAMGIHLLAFPGHKGLYGPQGTGGLYVHPDVPLLPMIQGGTGSRSEELEHPLQRPEGFESGTLNTPGIAGLQAGLRFVLDTGVEVIHRREMSLTRHLLTGLMDIDGITIYSPENPSLPVIAFNIEGVDGLEVASILDQHYEIAVRAGYHCAALAHRTIQTDRCGAVRVSPGFFNTEQDVVALLQALREIRKVYPIG